MELSKLLVFCAIILVVICEETVDQQVNPANGVRDNSKLAFIKKPKLIRLVPETKSMNPLIFFPNNITPRRQVISTTHKSQNRPIVPTNATEVEVKPKTQEHVDYIETKKPIQSAQFVDSPALNKNENDNESGFEQNNEETEVKVVQVPHERVPKKEIINLSTVKLIEKHADKSKEIKKSVLNDKKKDVPASLITEIKNPDLSDVENDLFAKLLTKYKVNHNTPVKAITPSEKLYEKTAIKPTITAKEGCKHLNNHTNVERFTEPINNATDNLRSSDISVKINPLQIIGGATKIMVPKIDTFQAPLTIKPKIKVLNQTNDSVDTILWKNIENENKSNIKKDPEVNFKSFNVEPNEELLIQNNNYEDLFESSAPQYLSQTITSKLRPAQYCNFNSIPPTNEKTVPQSYDKNTNYYYFKPYLYNINPDKNVINTYGELTKYVNDKNNFNETWHTSANIWNQGYDSYYQPQGCFGYTRNVNYRKQYPNRVWRSWQNNQIVIRPKSTNSLNIEELYAKGYLKNAGNMPVYNC